MKSNSNRSGRVAIANARLSLPQNLYIQPRSYINRSFAIPLTLVEDRRVYHPLRKQAPARSFSRHSHRLVVSNVTKKNTQKAFTPSYPSAHLAFEAPKRVLVCVRRKIRKEVIHALGHAGRGGQRSPRRSEYSSISC